jgi:hypothetical protein
MVSSTPALNTKLVVNQGRLTVDQRESCLQSRLVYHKAHYWLRKEHLTQAAGRGDRGPRDDDSARRSALESDPECSMAIVSCSQSSEAVIAADVWPPILIFRRALAYTGKSRATLNRAIASGRLRLFGRAGGPRGERTILRADLDAWLRGELRGLPQAAARSVDRTLARSAVMAGHGSEPIRRQPPGPGGRRDRAHRGSR